MKSCLAMTGEITLRGELLPIGGLKEKLLASVRLGVKQVILPEDNRKNLTDIPIEIKKKLKIKFFSDALQGVKFALEPKTGVKNKKTAKSAKCKI